MALQPGHSLMDWIRLTKSGKDLAGTGGRLLQVSLLELRKHHKRKDAWMAINGKCVARVCGGVVNQHLVSFSHVPLSPTANSSSAGKVFNVTEYMDYHPGGWDELIKGAGKDGTKLFNEVHSWVNYESMMSACLVGKLVQESNLPPRLVPSSDSSLKPKALLTVPSGNSRTTKNVYLVDLGVRWGGSFRKRSRKVKPEPWPAFAGKGTAGASIFKRWCSICNNIEGENTPSISRGHLRSYVYKP